MSVRDDVIELIDEMEEEDLRAVEQYARYRLSGARGDFLTWVLDNAPEDDEPITPEEEREIEEAREDVRQGRLYSAEDVKRMLFG